MFPPTIKSREIHKLTEGNSVFHLVTITFRVRGMKSANVTKHYASKIFKKMTSLMSISEFLSHIHTFLSAMVVAWQWSEHILVIAAHTFCFCLLFERSCSRKYPKWLIIYHVMILNKGTIDFFHFCIFTNASSATSVGFCVCSSVIFIHLQGSFVWLDPLRLSCTL